MFRKKKKEKNAHDPAHHLAHFHPYIIRELYVCVSVRERERERGHLVLRGLSLAFLV
jgi:hypothetical protein